MLVTNRFAKKPMRSPLWGVMLSLVLFLGVIVIFIFGVNSVSQTAETEQLNATKQAIARSAVHCYAIEGAYPENIAYLEEHYGLRVDSDKYVVHYNCFGSNIMPDIDVVSKDL